MMSLTLFIYGIFQIILYTVVSTLSTVYFFKKHNPFFIVLCLLFCVFALDNIIIMMTECIPMFSNFYDALFLSIPSAKTIIYITSSVFMVYIFNSIFYDHFVWKLYIPIFFMILLWLFIPIYQNNEVKVYIYYETFSIFMIVLGIFVVEKSKMLSAEKSQKLLKQIGYAFILFGIAIIIEDYIVIFNIDNYNPEHVSIQNRCYTEDVFRFLLSVTTIRYIVGKINPQLRANITSEPHPLRTQNIDEIHEEENEEESKFILTPEEKMNAFCKGYDLTAREVEILTLIIEHKNAQEISDALYIATGTVKTHMHKIYQKLGITKRTQLIQLYNEFNPEP